ncbi:MAG TPA: hypothetical protein ENH82_14065 [bacterium]|nr:hypothetical protein [bacterium]
MKKLEPLFRKILRLEAKEAEWGVKAEQARREYVKQFAPFKEGDKIAFSRANDTKSPSMRFTYLFTGTGIVERVSVDTHVGFKYWIRLTNKDFVLHKTKNPIWINQKEFQIKKGGSYE